MHPPAPVADRDARADRVATNASSTRSEGLDRYMDSATAWFRSMLRSFLLGYAVVLSTIAVWLHSSTSATRLLLLPVLSLPSVYRLLLRPNARRVAVAGLRHRPYRAVLVGSIAAAAALITTAVVIPDALHHSRNEVVDRVLGPVDELLVANSNDIRLKALAMIDRREASISVEQRAGTNSLKDIVVDRLMLSVTDVAVRRADHQVAAHVLEFNPVDGASFGADPRRTGLLNVTTLDRSHVDLGADLADDLHARPGDRVELTGGALVRTLTVRHVLPRVGLAALSVDGRANARVVLALPGSFSVPAREAGATVRSVVAYANRGDADATWKFSRSASEALNASIGESVSADTPEADVHGTAMPAHAIAVKADLLDNVDTTLAPLLLATTTASTMLGFAGVVMLAVAMFTAARSRRDDLQALRSLGELRGEAVGAVNLELWALALAGVVLGSVAGAIASRVVLGRTVAPRHLPGVVDVSAVPQFGGVATGLALSFLVAVGAATCSTFVFASTRPSGGPRPSSRRRLPWFAVLAVGLGLVGLSFADAGVAGLAAGLGLVVVAFVRLALDDTRLRGWGTGAVVALVSVVAARLLSAGATPTRVSAGSGLLLLGLLAGLATVLSRIDSTRRALPLRATQRVTTLAFTVITAAVVSAALVAVTLHAGAASTRDGRAHAAQSRFNVILRSVDASRIEEIEGRASVPFDESVPVATSAGLVISPSATPVPVSYGALDESYESGAVPSVRRTPQLSSDAEAFRAVREGSGVLLDRDTARRLARSGQPGATVFLSDAETGRSGSFRVAGVMDAVVGLPNVVVGPRSAANLRNGTSPSRVTTDVLVRTREPAALVDRLRSRDVDADTVADSVANELRVATSVTALLRFMGLVGLVAGALLTGLALVLSLNEQRDDVLARRAFGATQAQLRKAVLTGAGPMIAVGLGIAVVLAAVTLRAILAVPDAPFGGRWFPGIAWAITGVLGAALSFGAIAMVTDRWLRRLR